MSIANHLVLESLTNPNRQFLIKSYSKETRRGIIKGKMGVEFEEDLSKDFLTKWGYRVIQKEVDLDEFDTATRT